MNVDRIFFDDTRSQWFPACDAPAYSGFYERLYYKDDNKTVDEELSGDLDYFDGENWFIKDGEHLIMSTRQTRMWRGLATKPEGL